MANGKKILSVFMSAVIGLLSIVPAFAVSPLLNDENERAERCEDFYAQSHNNYVTENGFLFDLDTQTIVQYDKTRMIDTFPTAILNGTENTVFTNQDYEKLKTVIIPETIAGKTVRFIGNRAFMNAGIEQVEVPATVEKIGDYAFWENAIKNIVLHEGLKEIGNSAFNLVDNGSLVVPSTVNYIDFLQYATAHTNNFSVILKNPDTKIGYIGKLYGNSYKAIPQDWVTVDLNAELPEITYSNLTVTTKPLELWCEHTESDGFTYAYPFNFKWICKDCCYPSNSLMSICPNCGKTDIVVLNSNTEYFELFKEKYGMDLRQYAISKAVEEGLLVDEYTPIGTSEEISACIREASFGVFKWENGAVKCIYIPYILDYNSTADTTPDEITVPFGTSHLVNPHMFDNNETVTSFTVDMNTLCDWIDRHGGYKTVSNGENDDISDALMMAAINLLYSYASIRLFEDCYNLKTLNITDATDYSSMSEQKVLEQKALFSDFLTIFLNKVFLNNFTTYNLPEGYEYENGAIYRNNKTQLVAVVDDMEEYIMPDAVTDVNTFAFAERNIKNIIWSDNCDYIPSGCFAGAVIENIDFKSIKKIEDVAFYMTDIKSVELPNTLTAIGIMAFVKSSIESIVIPESVTSLAYASFGNCQNLKEVTVQCNITGVSEPRNELMFGNYSRVSKDYGHSLQNQQVTTLSNVSELLDFCSIFEFCPALTAISFGKNLKRITEPSGGDDINYVNIETLGYLPSLISISVSSENEDYFTFNNVLMSESKYGYIYPVLAPQGANYCDIRNINLNCFGSDGSYGHTLSIYVKPINSAVAGINDKAAAILDINHLYLSMENDSLNAFAGNGILQTIQDIVANPNYLHCQRALPDYAAFIPDTTEIVNELRNFVVTAEDNKDVSLTFENITGRIYKIPCWETLDENDYIKVNSVSRTSYQLLTTKEYLSIPASICQNGVVFSETNTIVKALRFEGDMNLAETLSVQYATFQNAYDIEFTENSVKSVLPDDVVEKYVWNDGYLHFNRLFTPVIQVNSKDDITPELIDDCLNELLFPWAKAVFGSEVTANDLLAFGITSFLKFADKDGVEIDDDNSKITDEVIFDDFIKEIYADAESRCSDWLSSKNITTIEEFKEAYINDFIVFDESTQTIEGMLIPSMFNGSTNNNLLVFPATINGVEVKNISPLVIYFFNEGNENSVYVPHTVEHLGYVSPNAEQGLKDTFCQYFKISCGFSTDEELDAFFNEEFNASLNDFTFSAEGNLTDAWGIFGTSETISISEGNPYFKKIVNAAGFAEIVSSDEKTCYATVKKETGYSDVWLSGKSENYAPSSLTSTIGSLYYCDVVGKPMNFQCGEYSFNVSVSTYACQQCYTPYSEDVTTCPNCGGEVAYSVMSMLDEKRELGSDWLQSTSNGEVSEKQTSKFLYFSDSSSIPTHCDEEHGQDCCSYIDPASLTESEFEIYTQIIEEADDLVVPKQENKLFTVANGTTQCPIGEFHEKQFYLLKSEIPNRYEPVDELFIAEPFQDIISIDLLVDGGTVNTSIYNYETESDYTGSAKFNVFDSTDNSLVASYTMTDGVASCILPIGEYIVVPEEIEGYTFTQERLPLSITYDGQNVDLVFEIYMISEYTVSIPEYVEATDNTEPDIPYQVTASDVRLSIRDSLNVTVEYSGKLKNKSQTNIVLEYSLYQNDCVLSNNDSVLFVPQSTDFTSKEFNAKLVSKPDYAGVYTDTVTFNVALVSN